MAPLALGRVASDAHETLSHGTTTITCGPTAPWDTAVRLGSVAEDVLWAKRCALPCGRSDARVGHLPRADVRNASLAMRDHAKLESSARHGSFSC